MRKHFETALAAAKAFTARAGEIRTLRQNQGPGARGQGPAKLKSGRAVSQATHDQLREYHSSLKETQEAMGGVMEEFDAFLIAHAPEDGKAQRRRLQLDAILAQVDADLVGSETGTSATTGT
jgi:hypothetical protein